MGSAGVSKDRCISRSSSSSACSGGKRGSLKGGGKCIFGNIFGQRPDSFQHADAAAQLMVYLQGNKSGAPLGQCFRIIVQVDFQGATCLQPMPN